tara:strand:- start:148 stop:405 length:258 start_codon:yes stop_codon:yes gene_type:complete
VEGSTTTTATYPTCPAGGKAKKAKKSEGGSQKQPPTLEKNIVFQRTLLYAYYIITLNPQVSDKIYYLYKNTNNYERVKYKGWSID